MKKTIALLLAASTLASLTACGGAGSSSGTSSGTNSGSTSSGEYPVVRWAYSRMFSTDSEAKVEEAMNEILRETCQAEIDLVPLDFSSMSQQLNLLLSGGSDSIDVFSSFWYLPMNTLYANGQLADMTELLEEYPEVLELFSDIPEALECCKIDGKYYKVPNLPM